MIINFRKKATVALFLLCMKVKKRYISISHVNSLLLSVWEGQQIKEKYQNGFHLKTISHNNQKSNQHIAGAFVNIHTKCEVSV